MAELFDEIAAVLESRSATRAMASATSTVNEPWAGNAAVLGVPALLTSLIRSLDDPATSAAVTRSIQMVDTHRLQDTGATIAARAYEPIGSQVSELLLGRRLPQLAASIAAEAGIAPEHAAILIPISTWVLIASIADRYGNQLDRASALSILRDEHQDLVENGWGPWISANIQTHERQYPLPSHRDAGRNGADTGIVDTSGFRDVARSALATVDRSFPSDIVDGSVPPSRTSEEWPVSARSAPASSVMSDPAELPPVSSSRQDPGDFNVSFESSGSGSNRRVKIFTLAAVALLLAIGFVGLTWLRSTNPWPDSAEESPSAAIAVRQPDFGTDADPGLADAANDGSLPTTGLQADQALSYEVEMGDPLGQLDASGVAALRFDPDAGKVCYNITTDDIEPPYSAHLHEGPPGVEGKLVVDLGTIGNGTEGCIDASSVELGAVLSLPAGHYVEVVDPGSNLTIRAQLSDAPMPAQPEVNIEFSPDGYGAEAIIADGAIYLEGAVKDKATRDALVAELMGLDRSRIVVVDNLEIVASAQLPTGLFFVEDDILFDIGSDQFDAEGTVLEDIAVLLIGKPGWGMTVIGHTDSEGDEARNEELSLRRANAIRSALVELGVESAQLRTEGAGSSVPIADNSTAEGRAANRSIEFLIERS